MFKIVIVFLAISSTILANLAIVNQPNIETDVDLITNYNVISFVDNNNVIVHDELKELPENSIVIDSSWDDNYHYYLLFKRGTIDSLIYKLNIGKILYDADKYLIFKSKIKSLREYDAFLPYDIVKIFNKKITRKKSSSENFILTNRSNSEIINSYIQDIKIDSIWNMIRKLQDMERYTYSSGSNNTANFLSNYFNNLNLDTVYQDKYLSNGSPNVIAQLNGTTDPNKIIIICGHYDAARSGYPAADDNGSGTSGNLEIARILSKQKFKNTIRFVLFSGEENGLLGSKDYAQSVSSKNENIISVFNLDMISYLKPGDPLYLDVCYDAQSSSLYNTYVNIADQYLPNLSICDSKNSPWKNSSDHKSFWDKNYPALYFGDDLDPTGPEHPNFHTRADSIGNGSNSKEYLEGVVKSVTATVATLAEPDLITPNIQHNNPNNFNLSINLNHKDRSIFITSQNINSHSIIANIYALDGQLLFVQNIKTNNVINLSKYSKGSYLIVFKAGKTIIKRKVTI